MDEPTLEQQEARVLAIIGGQILPVAWERDLRAAAATIRRHAELVRLCRVVSDDMEKWYDGGIKPDEWKLKEWVAALVAAIGKEPK